jgi:hypothetical protein
MLPRPFLHSKVRTDDVILDHDRTRDATRYFFSLAIFTRFLDGWSGHPREVHPSPLRKYRESGDNGWKMILKRESISVSFLQQV